MKPRARRAGFSLIEIMITLVVLSLALAAAGTLFNNLLGDFRQQSKISETGIETNIGLQLLKKDLENAGYGLPWNMGGLGGYNEATAGPLPTTGDSPAPPHAFSVVNGGSASPDYLAVRSMPVAGTDVSRKWTLLAAGGDARPWGDLREDFQATERVVVIRPGPSGGDSRTLNVVAGEYAPQFQNRAGFAPPSTATTYLMYGIDPGARRMPFNRADYFISTAGVSPPPICAPGTGTLVKAVVNQSDGSFTLFPLLDCVLDMQIVFQLADNTVVNDLGAGDADWIRTNVQRIFVYIMAHEGRSDERYIHDALDNVLVGDPAIGGAAMFREVDLVRADDVVATDQAHYRWKLYSLVVQPTTLR